MLASATPIQIAPVGVSDCTIPTNCMFVSPSDTVSGTSPHAGLQAAVDNFLGYSAPLTFLDKWDPPTTTWSNGDLDQVKAIAAADLKSGSWATVNGLPLVNFMSVKAGTGFTLFAFAPDGAPSAGDVFSTLGLLNNGGRQPGVSHITFWQTESPAPVPEPATFALIPAAMAGLYFFRRRSAA